jgi:hypothetical protein
MISLKVETEKQESSLQKLFEQILRNLRNKFEHAS